MSAQTDVSQVREQLQELIAAFAQNPSQIRKQLLELFANGRSVFCAGAVPLLMEAPENPAIQFIRELLISNCMLPMCDPRLLPLEEEIQIARDLMKTDPLLDTKLARRFSQLAGEEASKMETEVAERILTVLGAISDGTRILPMLVQVLRHPDTRLRSKAALLVGRTNKSGQWTDRLLNEPDARVRANTIEALWGMDSPGARALFWEATKDPNNRVVGNALLGLHQLGDNATIPRLLALTASQDPLFRATAAWVMGETEDPRFLPALGQMIREPNSIARHCVFDAIAKIKRAVTRAAEAPRLRLFLSTLKPQADGKRRIRAIVTQEGQNTLLAVTPARMVLWECSRMVADYTVERIGAPEALAIGMAIQEKQTPPAAADAVLDSTIKGCLAFKRTLDRWAVVRYHTETEPAGPAKNGTALCTLSADADVVRKEALRPSCVRSGMLDAARLLMSAVARTPAVRHLLLVDDGEPDPQPAEEMAKGWQVLVRQAATASISIHVVARTCLSRPHLAYMAIACDETGGIFLEAGDPENIPACCERICLNLLDYYEIRYPSEAESAGPSKLQIYAQQGFGEDMLPQP
ncbi:MAG: HEAT repeat domain-containing protein [Bryobacteraceae bacterium]